ncbi:hypothetical protein K7J14_15555 [Treponema zuelzerae]|uniref:YdeI/OmpD-associated family protein n=1 Tax=Teretinema zuelzerae TaxID=156 RepID=A0AAE3EKP1_9SPIR|nr:hypothetical protein [Teretinema zuelzerae]MCD1656085.1 hypothetical protein [Teretinema zuelzerae]MCD1656116.1 hypothetical protein [Teretinema zuelzerae]
MNEDVVVLEFENRVKYREWLVINHKKENSIWIEFKKGNKDFTANDALEESICFGWIDGVMKSINDERYRKYFSKRKDVHKWSEKNKQIFKKMVDNNAMTKSGVDVYLPEISNENTQLSIEDKIECLRNVLQTMPEIVRLYNEKPLSKQKQFAGFYCDAKTEETKNKRRNKIIDALQNNYNGMLY